MHKFAYFEWLFSINAYGCIIGLSFSWPQFEFITYVWQRLNDFLIYQKIDDLERRYVYSFLTIQPCMPLVKEVIKWMCIGMPRFPEIDCHCFSWCRSSWSYSSSAVYFFCTKAQRPITLPNLRTPRALRATTGTITSSLPFTGNYRTAPKIRGSPFASNHTNIPS